MDRYSLKALQIIKPIVITGVLVGAGVASATAEPTITNLTTATTPVTLSDNQLQPMVQSILASYKDKVNVTVKAGVVYLAGKLDSDTDYEKVITLAESIQGVTDVNADNLTVKDSNQPLKDTYITAKVKGALLESDIMGKDIPSWSVKVETKDGQVYLSGTVATNTEKQTILNVAKKVKGITKINDQIEVSGGQSTEETN